MAVRHLGEQPATRHLLVEGGLQPGNLSGWWLRCVTGEEVFDAAVGVDLDVGTLADPLADEQPLLLAERWVGVVHHLRKVICPVGKDRPVRLDANAVPGARQLDHVAELRLDERFLCLAHRCAGVSRHVHVPVGRQRHVLTLAERVAHGPQIVVVADDLSGRGGDVGIQRRRLTGHRSTV